MELNKIYNMDCLDGLKQLKDNSIDCIVTSPPYWKGFEYEAYFNSYKQYLDWCKLWLIECKRILKPNGNFFLNVINDSEITIRAYEILDIAKNIMFKLHDTIIWYRFNQQPANTDRQLTNQVEFLFLLRNTSNNVKFFKDEVYKKLPKLFKTKNVGNVLELSFNSQKSEFGKKELNCKFGHSGFPLELPLFCIYLTTKENDVVLDCFMGSGTTALACIKSNRKFIGFELDESYCKIANKRIQNEFKQKRLNDWF